MNVLVLGATGMVGQGVLRECLRDPRVGRVMVVGRRSTGLDHARLREMVHPNLFDLSGIEPDLAGIDACFYCLGVSALGMREQAYAHLTYDLTLAIAERLVRANPAMTFVYVSGTGTDSSESGSVMWARVKGRTENALLRLGFEAAYMFRPGVILPMHGIRSRTFVYRFLYALTRPLWPVLRRLPPRYVTTTERVGRAMIAVVIRGASTPFLGNAEINALADTDTA